MQKVKIWCRRVKNYFFCPFWEISLLGRIRCHFRERDSKYYVRRCSGWFPIRAILCDCFFWNFPERRSGARELIFHFGSPQRPSEERLVWTRNQKCMFKPPMDCALETHWMNSDERDHQGNTTATWDHIVTDFSCISVSNMILNWKVTISTNGNTPSTAGETSTTLHRTMPLLDYYFFIVISLPFGKFSDLKNFHPLTY